MKLDILALAAHPDDTELGCGGTLAAHIALGRKVGVVDFTRGELGTRGSAGLRQEEAKASADMLGLAIRENLGFRDGFFVNDEAHQREVMRVIRKYQPDVVLANAHADRHPDHGKAAQLAIDACFLAGLKKIDITDNDGKPLEAWRPKALYHYIQSRYIHPDFVMDVSAHWDQKIKAIMAFKSQFYDPESNEPDTFISSEGFLKMIEGRGREFGQVIGTAYGEGFCVNRTLGLKDLTVLI